MSNHFLPKVVNSSWGMMVALLTICLIPSSCHVGTNAQGERIYLAKCANCHMEDGSGLGRQIPSLQSYDYSDQNLPKLYCVIRHGIKADSIGEIMQAMPAQPKMSEVEMLNLINYLREQFNNPSLNPLTLKDFQNLKGECLQELPKGDVGSNKM